MDDLEATPGSIAKAVWSIPRLFRMLRGCANNRDPGQRGPGDSDLNKIVNTPVLPFHPDHTVSYPVFSDTFKHVSARPVKRKPRTFCGHNVTSRGILSWRFH